MQSRVIGSNLKKLIQSCYTNQILNIDSHSSIQYGPLGSLLKRNIFDEWLCSLLKNNDVHIFPVEVVNPRKKTFLWEQTSSKPAEQLVSVILENYFETIKVLGCALPLGFAVYGPCLNENTRNTEITIDKDLSFLSYLTAWTRLSLIFFCPPKKPIHWFHYWSKQRYLWWRKFSSTPSKFSLSEVTSTPTGDQYLSLVLESSWGKDALETITLHSNAFAIELFQKYSYKRNNSDNELFAAPAIVTCEAELDLALLAYLSNSFAEKWRDGQTKNVFQFHYKLAPYKVCISLEETNAENLKTLQNVASHLVKELKETGISIFPTSAFHVQSPIRLQFEKCDEMGIPYTIVLNESSLFNGIAGLRNRDTTLQEQIHISDLTSKLVKYLKTNV